MIFKAGHLIDHHEQDSSAKKALFLHGNHLGVNIKRCKMNLL